MIKNIIFDMGGVLIDYDPEKTAHKYFDDETAEIVLKEFLRSSYWREKDRGTIFPNEIIEKIKDKIPEHAMEIVQKFADNFYDFMPEFEDMRELVKTLKNNGYKIYLLSNASPDFYTHTGYIRAFDYFDGFVVSADYRLLKPEKEIYNVLFKKFNLKPNECFFIDDTDENIKGAKAVGMPGHTFKYSKKEELFMSFEKNGIDYEVKNLPVKQNCKWSLVVPTSMGVRLTAPDGQTIASSDTFKMQATSAETNVASISSYLGLPVKVLTTFVKDSQIAAFIKQNLRSRGMDFEGKDVEKGGPWGYRHQFNIADSGSGSRGPRVENDRAGEVGRTLNVKDFDLDRIFGEEGVAILHLSGLIAALSPETGEFCLELAKVAKKYGTLISFDLNFRATFWKGREQELRSIFSQICAVADILVGNEEDFQLCLGIEGPQAGGKDINDKIDAFKEMIGRVRVQYPNAKVFGTTLRQVINANTHLWGAILLSGDEWQVAMPREIKVLDRIGGGDGFVGGLLYAIAKGWEPEKQLEFAWASGALATTFLTDYAQPADEDMIWSVWSGNARVKR